MAGWDLWGSPMAPRRILCVFAAAAVITDHASGVSFLAMNSTWSGNHTASSPASSHLTVKSTSSPTGLPGRGAASPKVVFLPIFYSSSESSELFTKLRNLLTML